MCKNQENEDSREIKSSDFVFEEGFDPELLEDQLEESPSDSDSDASSTKAEDEKPTNSQTRSLGLLGQKNAHTRAKASEQRPAC